MLYHREGYPQDSELVLCTVTKVQSHSVFVRLDAYNKSAMLHISEVSPGRIRNLREFVSEGKVIVCKVLAVNPVKGHIDVSLRRVSEGHRISLMNQMKQEMKAEKIIEFLSQEKKIDVLKIYNTVFASISKQYNYLYEAFNDFIAGTFAFESSGLEPSLHEALVKLVRQRIKPPQVEILAQLKIISYSGNGVEQIRDTLIKAAAVDEKQMKITYGGAGLYSVRIITDEFKTAERILKDTVTIVESVFKDDKNAVYEFSRQEGKQIS